jgi:hypothetical protein
MCFKKIWNKLEEISKKILEKDFKEEKIEYPILTRADVNKTLELITYEKGIPEIDIPCEGPDCIFESTIHEAGIPVEYEDENGITHTLYGHPGTTLINGETKIVTFQVWAECRTITERYPDGRPKKGSFKYRLNYDPNNDFVHKFSTADMQPGEVIEEWVDKNPNYDFYKTLIPK